MIAWPYHPTAGENHITIDEDILVRVVRDLASIGSCEEGFRVTGTPEDRRAAEYIAGELAGVGLQDVGIEEVPVDAWRFHHASVTLADGTQWECASLGSFPPTPKDGVTGEVVVVGDGRRRSLDGLDLAGKVALLDWREIPVSICDVVLELGLRGVVAVILCSLDGGARFQGQDALGSSVSSWHEGSPPLVTMRKRHAYELLDRGRSGDQMVTVRAEIEITRDAPGCNVISVFPGERNDLAPIVVAAHHDAWFSGAWDNATGVAAVIAIADALQRGGWKPRRPVVFGSHTAEEYGRIGEPDPWCYGSWARVTQTHPQWGGSVPLFLNIEASGHPGLPALVEAPPELRKFATRFFRKAKRDGVLPLGWWYSGDPVTGTDAWPFQLMGVPSMSVYNWHKSIVHTDYHTTNDVPSLVDYAYLADLTRMYLDILVEAERSIDSLLDHGARRAHVARLGGDERLTRAAEAYAEDGSRKAFTRLARGGIAVDADGNTGYLHLQAARDATQLAAALEALGAGDRKAAARAALKVGANSAYSHLSREAFAISRKRSLSSEGSWAEGSHRTEWPDLWEEIAALRGDPGARTSGPWVARSLERHLARATRERDRRIARLETLLAGRNSP